jgi:transcriptional regulator with XRE-family HTH domain
VRANVEGTSRYVPVDRLGRVDDIRVGGLFRAVRLRRRWRQEDVAEEAGVSRSQVSRAERGRLAELRLCELRFIADALEIRLPFAPLWRGGEADRVVNERHSLMHERLALLFARLPAWVCSTEVTFSVFGERGSIDLLAWHPGRRALLIVELKTEIPDPAALVAQVDRYRRLAAEIVRERGWIPVSVSTWVVVADSSMNRRRLARHRTMLRNRFPVEGRRMRSWLRQPAGSVAALSFLADDRAGSTVRKAAPTRRVSRPIRVSRTRETVADAHGPGGSEESERSAGGQPA